jgi:hypothetical protein
VASAGDQHLGGADLGLGTAPHQRARCYRVSYPLNRLPADVREKFFHNYPLFAEAQDEPRAGS